MTFEEFITKYDGKGIDFDGAFGTQCVDLYRQYVKEVLGYPQSPLVEGAKDIWDTYLPDYYQRIENTPYGVPEKGDIVIFGDTMGKYGHVSIFIEGTASRFTSFDQNYPTGSLCHKQGHTYNAVLGWLRPLKKENDMPDYLKTLIQEAGLDINNEGEFRAFWQKALVHDEEVTELKAQVTSLSESLADRAREVSVLTEKNDTLTNKMDELQEQLNKARSKRDQEAWRADKLTVQVDTLEGEVAKLAEKIVRLEADNSLYAYSWWERLISLFKGGD